MKTTITLSAKTAHTVLITGSALLIGLFIYMVVYGDFGSIYLAF